jgi:hypothetical protein
VGYFVILVKAFDSVSHEMLLNKLMYYGIKDTQNNLYKSYLSHRKQKTILKDTSSLISFHLLSYIPQG